MKEPGTLVILTPGFPASESDTVCLPPVQQFCRILQNDHPGVNLTIVSFQYPFKSEVYKWHGIEVHAMNGRNKAGFARTLTWMRVYWRLRKIKKQHRLLGVLSLWLGETALVGKRFSSLNRLPHYTWLQGQDAKKQNRYVKLVKPEAGSLIAISAFNSDEFEKNHGVRPFMIAHNGINAEVFPVLNQGERDIDILGAGSLIPLKNYSAFIRVVHEIKKDHPNVRAAIAGYGEEARELSALAFRLGLQHNLKLIGGVPHEEVLQMMNRSQVFLHTSEYEGMSTVMLEALYSGCHVVSFQKLSPEPVAKHTICEKEDEMVSAVKTLLEKDSVSERTLVFNMHDTVRKIAALYER